MSKTKILSCAENSFVLKKNSCMLHKKSSGVDKEKLMLHKKVFHLEMKMLILHRKVFNIEKSKLMLHRKVISCTKKLLIFSRMVRHNSMLLKGWFYNVFKIFLKLNFSLNGLVLLLFTWSKWNSTDFLPRTI